MPTLAKHKKAYHEYEVLEEYEAGIMLAGSEVKSLRKGNVSLKGSFITEHAGELMLTNTHIGSYKPAAQNNHDPVRSRKLLLKKNEVKDGVIFKIRNDPRITRIGRLLRRYSLDELPQLLNVLFGDMSLVGPRPFSVEESAKFDYNHMPRLNIKPGITGLSQIKGRSNLLFRRWIKWDLWYINNWSFWLDLYILWQTIPAVLRGKGAY